MDLIENESQEPRTISPSLLADIENYEKYSAAKAINFEDLKAQDPSYSHILPHLTNVRSLSTFRTIGSGHQDYMTLANYIAHSTIIRKLDLRYENESSNLADFLQVIQTNTHITKLDVQYMEIRNHHIIDQILSMKLKSLKLHHTQIYDEAEIRFKQQKILPQRLILQYYEPFDVESVVLMRSNITRLELLKVNLTTDLFGFLLDNLSDTITYLDVSNRPKRSGIPENHISIAGLTKLDQFLSTNRTLRTIILDGAIEPENDEFANFGESLKINNTLQTLSLRECDIPDQVVLKIADALKVNKTLLSLELYDNHLEMDTYTKLIAALIANDTLTGVSFGRYEQHYAFFYDVGDLIKETKSLESIEVSHAAGDSDYSSGLDDLMDALQKNTTISTFLFQVNFYGGGKIHDLFSENYTITKSSLGPTELVQKYCARNRSHQRQQRENIIIVIHYIARDSTIRDKLPVEIWQQIFGYIKYPRSKSFGSAVRSIFNEKHV